MLLRQQPSRYCSGYGCGMAASGAGGYFGSPQASGAYFAASAGSGYCSGGIPSSGYGSVPQSPGWNSTVPSTSSPSSSSQYRPRSFSTSSNNGNSPTIVAIDSKIEQAMDLVKTHLMFAVREEVEVLRSKIVDLESHIHHLEAENAVLKEHIPDDILKNLTISKD